MRVMLAEAPSVQRPQWRRVTVAGEFGNGPGTHLAQATNAMHEVTKAAASTGRLALLDFRALRGRCFAAEFELAAQLSTWRIPPGTRVAVLDHEPNRRLWERWAAIAMEQRRYVEAFTDADEAASWLSE